MSKKMQSNVKARASSTLCSSSFLILFMINVIINIDNAVYIIRHIYNV